MKKTALTLATAAALVLGTALPAHAAATAPATVVNVQPTHHRAYNKPTCWIALTFVLFTGWRTVEQNCGGHRRIT